MWYCPSLFTLPYSQIFLFTHFDTSNNDLFNFFLKFYFIIKIIYNHIIYLTCLKLNCLSTRMTVFHWKTQLLQKLRKIVTLQGLLQILPNELQSACQNSTCHKVWKKNLNLLATGYSQTSTNDHLTTTATFLVESPYIACKNIRFSSLFAAGDVSHRGMSATQRQKFHTDDIKSVRNLVRRADWSTE